MKKKGFVIGILFAFVLVFLLAAYSNSSGDMYYLKDGSVKPPLYVKWSIEERENIHKEPVNERYDLQKYQEDGHRWVIVEFHVVKGWLSTRNLYNNAYIETNNGSYKSDHNVMKKVEDMV